MKSAVQRGSSQGFPGGVVSDCRPRAAKCAAAPISTACALAPRWRDVLRASEVAEPLPMSMQLLRTVSRPSAPMATSAMTPSLPVP